MSTRAALTMGCGVGGRQVTALEAARELRALGISVISLPAASKEPRQGKGWRRFMYRPATFEELPTLFSDPGCNIAVIGGKVSSDLFLIDADSPAALKETLRAFDGLGARAKVWLRQRPPSGSDHDGGGLVVARSTLPLRGRELGASLALRAEGQYGLVPPSFHPDGEQYFWAQRDGDLPIIGFGDLARVWPNLKPAPRRKNLTSFAWSILRGDPQVLGRYPSRSEAEYALCLSLCQTGHELNDAIRLFQCHPCAGKFAELHQANPARAIRWLAGTWENAVKWASQHPASEGVAELAADLEAWACLQPWKGRTGAYDRAVYLAHLGIVQRCGRDPYGASCRELGELSGVNFKTAIAANRRLAEAGLIICTDRGSQLRTNAYSLAIPASFAPERVRLDQSSHVPCGMTAPISRVFSGHDLWRRAGLGKCAAQLAQTLWERGTVTEKELQSATGRVRSTVRSELLQMMHLGLVAPLGDRVWRWMARGDLTEALDRAASELGVDGALAIQQARHRRARARHREWLARPSDGPSGDAGAVARHSKG